MNRQRGISMQRMTSMAAGLMVAGLLAGCDLDVENPNAPDAERAFQDPAGLEGLLGGAFRTWVQTRGDYYIMALNAMADSYTASWNNAAMRYHSSVGSDCPQRCGWNNSSTAPEANGGLVVDSQWYGYYTVLSAGIDIMRAVNGGLCFDDDCTVDDTQTSRNVAIAKMLQGMALGGIAMVYDQGFAVDEDDDLTVPTAIPFSTRAEMRDLALQKFEEAYAEAGLKSWSTPPEWMGVGAGTPYTNEQIRRLIRTMQAELVAMFPRNGAENGPANAAGEGTASDWAAVAQYASEGISSGTPFEWQFYIDAGSAEDFDYVKLWGNSIGTERVDTRVAAMITTNHVHPWPEPSGNPCPTTSPDRRVGDGSYGPTDNFNGYSTRAATANAGTDFACSRVAIFPAARGQYHQSNLQHVRYQHLAYVGENLPGFDGTGQDPMYTRQMNDLLWAEGLIRSGGDKGVAALRINNSRVTRGGLVGLTGAETDAAMLTALQYEQEIEFMGQGITPFFNRRRIDGLIPTTPRHMPVPAKEMDVLLREIYTFGGPSAPDMSVGRNGSLNLSRDGRQIRTVREIWEDYRRMARMAAYTRW